MVNLDDKESFDTLAEKYGFRSIEFLALYEFVERAPAHIIEADFAMDTASMTETATTTKQPPSILPAKLQKAWLNAPDDLKRDVIVQLRKLGYPANSTTKYTEEYRKRRKYDQEIEQLAAALNVCYMFMCCANLR